MTRSTRSRRAAIAVAALVLLTAAGCGDDREATTTVAAELSGYEQDPPLEVAGISLPEASNGGAEFELVAQPGHLLIAYFGYTSCPDVCPTTLSEVKKAMKQLGDQANKVDLAMVTIDPDRDTDDVITNYLRSFVPNAHALRTTDQERLVSAAEAFGASFSVVTNDQGAIEVSHSPNMYLVDEHGTVILTWLFGIPAEGIATDLDIMLGRIEG